MDETEFKKLELLYKESSTMFRYFLTWRQLLFAGYFAVIASLALGFRWTLSNAPDSAFVCPFVGFLIGLLFWALDYRNRQLYKLASKVGDNIEKELGHEGLGCYGAYQSKEQLKKEQSKKEQSMKHKLHHSQILGTFYIGSGVVMLLFGVLTCCFEDEKEIPLSHVPKKAVVAVEHAVEGITITEAEVKAEDGLMVYELEGTVNGTEYDIEVTADGNVLEVK
jgi:uncharacterized membrane protein YkoI